MRFIAIVLNILLLIVLIYLFFESPPKKEYVLVILLFATPLSSLIALLLKGSESWLGLYFKRKMLEEKNKIEKLKD